MKCPTSLEAVTTRNDLSVATKKPVNLLKGEPGFNTPDHIKEAARRAIAENFTHYVSPYGIPELREAAAHRFTVENSIPTKSDQIAVSCGAKQGLFNTIQSIVDAGDEVVMFNPQWYLYTDFVLFAGGKPVLLTTKAANDYQPDPEEIRASLTPRTRAILINSPSNPTGAVYERSILEEIARIAIENDLIVISDEVYDRIIYEGATHISIASLGDEIAARCVTINSVSKTHAMTGWRVGYAAMPKPLAEKVAHLQGMITSGAAGISQKAALAALTGDQSHVARWMKAYTERRDRIMDRLESHRFLSARRPQGTFYCFIDVSPYLGGTFQDRPIADTHALVKLLQEEEQLLLGSGLEFGSDRHLRFAFCHDLESIEEGLERLLHFADSCEPNQGVDTP